MPPQQQHPLLVLWDFDNINPLYIGVPVIQFYHKLRLRLDKAAEALYGPGHSFDLDVRAYLVHNVNYSNAPEKLRDLQVEMRLSSAKAESVDRDLARDLRRACREADGKKITVAILSSDKDFIQTVREAKRDGHEIIVVHAAHPGTDHELLLEQFPTLCVSLYDGVLPPQPGAKKPKWPVQAEPEAPTPQGTTSASDLADILALVRKNIAQGDQVSPELLRLLADAQSAGDSAAAAPAPPVASSAATSESGDTRSTTTLPPIVSVAGEDVDTSELVANRGLRELAHAGPGAEGRWCPSTDALHHLMNCQLIHRYPATILVNDEPVATSDLLHNAMFTFLLQNPGRSGKWCAAPYDHDPRSCRFAHRRGDASEAPGDDAQDWFTTIKVDGVAVSVDDVLANKALDYLRGHPAAQGKKCRKAAQHNAMLCDYIHLKDGASVDTPDLVRVDGVDYDASTLLDNVGLQFLREHPLSNARFCSNFGAAHDADACSFIHRKDGQLPPITRVKIDGELVPVQALVENRCVEYLRANPGAGARRCNNSKPHDVPTCRYAHFKAEGGAVPPPPPQRLAAAPPSYATSIGRGAAAPVGARSTAALRGRGGAPSDDDSTTTLVNVQGCMVPAVDLVLNCATVYLRDHPNRQGRICVNDREHDPRHCSFVHFASPAAEARHARPASGAGAPRGGRGGHGTAGGFHVASA